MKKNTIALLCLALTSAIVGPGCVAYGQSSFDNDQQSVAQCTQIVDHGAVFWQL